MTSASRAVQVAAIAAADGLTDLEVRGGVTRKLPHWRIETVDEPETGRNKEGAASAPVVFASIFSRDMEEVYSEMGTMANSLPAAILPDGFRVLGTSSRVRQIAGSEEPDNVIYGRQLEIELIVEPTS
jgi:hypothetical protein